MMMWYGGGWMVLWMALFWAGLVVLVFWAVRSANGEVRRTSRPEPGRALQILEERFARGEIDRDEFEERRSALEGP